MQTFIMVTRLATGALRSPQSLEELEHRVMERIRSECPEVEWVVNYAVLGPWDYLDIFRAPDSAIATKVSTLIRTFGHAHTEVYTATEWDEYKELVRKLPSGEIELAT